ELREAASDIEVELSGWFVDTGTRSDLYAKIKALSEKDLNLSKSDAKYLKDSLRDFERSGLGLPATELEIVKANLKKLSELSNEFSKNLAEDKQDVLLTKEELEGVSEETLNSLKKADDGRYIVPTHVTTTMYSVVENAKSEETRKKLEYARNIRAKDKNVPLLSQFMQLRQDTARRLGFATWADYKTENKMAGTGATAVKFVDDLIVGLQPKFEAEVESLRQLKVEETGDANAKIEFWDFRYFINQLKIKKYQIDDSELKNFFEMRRTLNGMFSFFEGLFGIKITKVKAEQAWAPDVELYVIQDAASEAPLGQLYLDFYPRENKYGHFASFTVEASHVLPSGAHRRPVNALICNFPTPVVMSDGVARSLLTFDNVETLFHEFGHALHDILSPVKNAGQAGTNVPRDFVEAPSQMLEYFVQDPNVIKLFAQDWRNPKNEFPFEILDKLEEANLATVGILYRRQLAFGKLDLEMHTSNDPNIDANEVTNRVMGEVFLPVNEGSTFITSFGHLFGGYDAGYYGYAWADSIAADMASVFEEAPGGYSNKEVGRRLRKEIYESGSSKPILESVENFLQRKQSNKAFLKKLGIGE
ncbi:MAG: Zn-dependent oligopeptidase, partial [Bdellovibrionales bacterium]|nr:Zn-dependent oligopeptidase [Bdellovibrionales bacterium]